MTAAAPQLSIVIPVYNEAVGLRSLFDRLYPALDRLGPSYEAIFVDDGSRDRSVALLKDQYLKRPDVTRVIVLNANYGQHMAIVAGFDRSRGEPHLIIAQRTGYKKQGFTQYIPLRDAHNVAVRELPPVR